MKIVQLQIHNLLSYDRAEKIRFDNYNVIVGPNGSGKTNLARILELIRNPQTRIDDKRLELDLKFNNSRSSSVQIDVRLNGEEMKMLFELLFNRAVDDHNYDENMTTLSIFLEWTKIYEEGRPPDTVILYFYNRLILWADGAYVNVSYIRTFLESIDKIKSDIEEAIDIDKDQQLKENYHNQKGYSHTELFSQRPFQDALIMGNGIKDFFEIDSARINIRRDPFVVSYNLDRTNEQNAHTVRIFNYLGIKYPSANAANIWLLVSHFLQNITIQKEIRPNFENLAKELVWIKDSNIERYNSINGEFSVLFPNLSFDASSQSNAINTNSSVSAPRIKIKEKDPVTGSTYTSYLQDSASGYYELLYLLLEKSQKEDNVLVLDEPALHLHPNKIRHLNRLLIGSLRQMILITHSPYFVDINIFGLGRSLIYIRRDSRSSRAVWKPDNTSIGIRNYIFDPNIFFSKYNILVEGPGDAASFFAISDSLDSIFEKYNITVINAGGDGHIDPYMRLMEHYQIPYISMVDYQYNGIHRSSQRLVKLDNKLEHELNAAGWKGSLVSSIDPDAAYEFVFSTIQNGNAEKIRATKIGKIFDQVLTDIGEYPDNFWKLR